MGQVMYQLKLRSRMSVFYIFIKRVRMYNCNPIHHMRVNKETYHAYIRDKQDRQETFQELDIQLFHSINKRQKYCIGSHNAIPSYDESVF